MELTLPSLPYQLSALLFFILALKFLHKKKATNTQSKLNLPPGPWTLPFIGCLHHLANGKLPQHAMRDLARSYGPVMLLRVGQIDQVVITSREAAQEVMKTQYANFSDRPLLSVAKVSNSGCDIIFSTGAYWRLLRRTCVNGLLSPKRVKSLSSIRHEEVHSMLEWLSTFSDKSPVKIFETVSKVSINIVTRAVFGGRCKRQDMFLKALMELVQLSSWFCLSDVFPSLSWLDVKMRREILRIYRVLDSTTEEIVQDHLEKQKQRENNGDEDVEYDLVDILIKTMKDDNGGVSITFDSIKTVILDMFAGGTDTTTTTIEWTMAELIKHPEILAKVQAEIRSAASEKIDFNENDLIKLRYLKLVIKEAMRLHPPAPLLLPRQCKDTCEVLGYSIPSGARVLINAWALGRDPEYWTDAEQFIPERFEGSSVDFKGNNLEFVPFGAGKRSCPGMDFATAVVEIVLFKLLLHFDWKLPDGLKPNELDMTEEFGASCRMKKPLSLIPILRVPFSDV
ncbi:Cytochrome P450 [Rhynchospora pubera]|uniref:Cytochrome P450 n=1 Tax=Rhynchospora pubera TaxID=906938 RepID=A0AAV8FZR4_9POAL|nr:Cytochrome P450 [Rhynchospora pubera]KAJ4796377.1 Cytochrome P450 [Rhynchospora pubera]